MAESVGAVGFSCIHRPETLHEEETSSNELVSCVWRQVGAGNGWKWV